MSDTPYVKRLITTLMLCVLILLAATEKLHAASSSGITIWLNYYPNVNDGEHIVEIYSDRPYSPPNFPEINYFGFSINGTWRQLGSRDWQSFADYGENQTGNCDAGYDSSGRFGVQCYLPQDIGLPAGYRSGRIDL